MNNTLVTAATQSTEQLKATAPRVLQSAATGSSATTSFIPNFSIPSLKSLVPSAPQWAKNLWNTNTTAVYQNAADGLGSVKDSAVKALGDALSAAVPDVIENAAKAHPAVAGFVAGASVVGAVAYRKEIREGVTTGFNSGKNLVVNSASAASTAKAWVEKKLGLSKPAPVKAADPKEPVKASPPPVTVVVPSPNAKSATKDTSPAKSPAADKKGWGTTFLNAFSRTGQPATPTASKTSTGTSPAKSPLIKPDLAAAIAATNANAAAASTKLKEESGAKVKPSSKRQRAS